MGALLVGGGAAHRCHRRSVLNHLGERLDECARQSFRFRIDGRPTNIDPIAAIFNQAVAYEFPHMLAAAYMTAGFLVAGVFAMARLRGHWDRYPRLGFAIPFTVAAIVAPLQMLIGDTVARTVFQQMPVKFAAVEIVWTTGPDQPEILLGRLNQDTGVVEGGLAIPGMASWLSGFSTSTVITGLSTVPRQDQPPASIVHWAWDGMIFNGTGPALLATWFRCAGCPRRLRYAVVLSVCARWGSVGVY